MMNMEGNIYDLRRHAETARKAAAEGIVLLRNEGKVLPLREGEKIALFGRAQYHYYKSGTGSGGLVNTVYVKGIREALADGAFVLNEKLGEVYEQWLKTHPFDEGFGWAGEPWFQEEMPLTEEIVRAAREESDTAIIVIGRTAGEDQDNKAEEGSYYLTSTEKEMLRVVCGCFERTIVLLNVGNIIEMGWVEEIAPSAVLYVWQGGQEGGNGVLDVLCGRVSPSGKLPDTIPKNLEDIPSVSNHGSESRNIYQEDIYVGYRYFETFARDKVLYPFGFGLSYTSFSMECMEVAEKEEISVSLKVKNTGNACGKEVIQVYCKAPQGELGKPNRVLCGFAKTKELMPEETQEVELTIPWSRIASYDDSGASGHKSCWVLEAGTYAFYVGADVRSAVLAGEILLNQTLVTQVLEEACSPVTPFERIRPKKEADGSIGISYEAVPLRSTSPMERREERLPQNIPYAGEQGILLSDVESGKASMESFLSQLTDEDLCCIVRGEGMCSPKVTPGTAGAFGGITEHLRQLGIPIACCADGPSGIRMDSGNIAFAIPNGTCLASTFNEELCRELFEWEGLELRKNKIDTLLGPGLNIHRSPLNGRNFEYFSEDPLLTGRMAAVQLQGMAQYHVTGTIKHFACNSQEYKRRQVEAVVSERALREIYLKGFEIVVKEAGAYSIMTAYNPVNGFWAASNYDLLTTILRKEWGYTGIVMTDWWAMGNDEGEEGRVENVAAMVRAQNDLFMVTENAQENSQGDNSKDSLEKGSTLRCEYLRSAKNICCYLMRTPAYWRMLGQESELDKALTKLLKEEQEDFGKFLRISVKKGGCMLPLEEAETSRGSVTTMELKVEEKGSYQLEFSCRVVGQGSLAQIPLTISQDKEIVKTLTLTGDATEWRKEKILLNPFVQSVSFVKLYFGQGGMEIKDGRLVSVRPEEEK